jgi:hypothetical protein
MDRKAGSTWCRRGVIFRASIDTRQAERLTVLKQGCDAWVRRGSQGPLVNCWVIIRNCYYRHRKYQIITRYTSIKISLISPVPTSKFQKENGIYSLQVWTFVDKWAVDSCLKEIRPTDVLCYTSEKNVKKWKYPLWSQRKLQLQTWFRGKKSRCNC